MSRSTVEIDFFQMEKRNASPTVPPSPDPAAAGAPLRGIQGLVSRINPQLLKTVMASGASARGETLRSSGPSSPTAAAGALLPPLPVLHPASSRSASHCGPEMAPLTIFYNGTVAAFDVPPDKAEVIMRMAETGLKGKTEDASLDGGPLEGDLPIARRKSLQRFLEKRKERLATASPYCEGTSHP